MLLRGRKAIYFHTTKSLLLVSHIKETEVFGNAFRSLTPCLRIDKYNSNFIECITCPLTLLSLWPQHCFTFPLRFLSSYKKNIKKKAKSDLSLFLAQDFSGRFPKYGRGGWKCDLRNMGNTVLRGYYYRRCDRLVQREIRLRIEAAVHICQSEHLFCLTRSISQPRSGSHRAELQE
jgi:hypothetical protein